MNSAMLKDQIRYFQLILIIPELMLAAPSNEMCPNSALLQQYQLH